MPPGVVEAAGALHPVGPGRVDELAGDLLGAVARDASSRSVAVAFIDVAKALAAASGGTQVAMAVPTTLSGAEMTRIHRRARAAIRTAATVRAARGGR